MVQKAWELLHWKTPPKFLFQDDDKTSYTLCNSGLVLFSWCFSPPSPIILLPSWPWKLSRSDRQSAICLVPALASHIPQNSIPASHHQTSQCYTCLKQVGKKDKMAAPTDWDQRRGLFEIQYLFFLTTSRRIKSFPPIYKECSIKSVNSLWQYP